MTLADTTAEPGLAVGHRLWPHIQSWAAELGLTAPDAIATGPRLLSQGSCPWYTERVPGTGQTRQTPPVCTQPSDAGCRSGVDLAGRPRYLPRVLKARGQVAVACHVPIRF
jgi:hypothetical protein